MIADIVTLGSLLHRRSKILLGLVGSLVVAQRLTWAVFALGVERFTPSMMVAGAMLALIWASLGVCRSAVARDFRCALTMRLAEAPLLDASASWTLSLSELQVAIYEGRYVAERVLLHLLPGLIAEALAGVLLVILLSPISLGVIGGIGVAFAVATAAGLAHRIGARHSDETWKKYLVASQNALTSFTARQILLASGREDAHLAKTRRSVEDWATAAARSERTTAVIERLPLLGAGLFAALLVARSHAPTFAEIALLACFLPPIIGLSRSIFELFRSMPKVRTLWPAVDSKGGPPPANEAEKSVSIPTSVEFDAVGFSYPSTTSASRRNRVVENLSFTWQAGRVLGVTGPNGAGKTTTIELLLGLLAPETGQIKIDGIEIDQVNLRIWRRRIAFLPQSVTFPEGFTVRQLLTLTTPVTDERAITELRVFGVWETLSKAAERPSLSDPMEAKLDELSAGERQRVLLAWVFAQDAPILILDEPDANLDKDGRAILCRAVRSWDHRRMIAVVSHSQELSAIADDRLDLAKPQALTLATSPEGAEDAAEGF
jgi:ABC-type multidrug transport system fused ATPase/permease subunit